MNILYHHRTQAQGAAGTHIRQVAQAFKKLGNKVDIVSPPFVADPMIEQNSDLVVTRSRIPQIVFELYEIVYNFISVVRIGFKFIGKKYNLIYERYAIFNLAGLIAAKLNRIPIFIEVSFTSKTIVFPKRTKLFSGLAFLVDKIIFSNVDAIIVVSSVLKQGLIDDFKISDSRIMVIPNAVDETVFHPDVFADNVKQKYDLYDHPVIGFVGGFYPWHGLDFFIDCLPDVVKQFPDIRVLLVGDGVLLKSLEKKVDKIGLNGKVIFTGSVLHKQVPEYIAAFDIGVMPDSNNYGSPMKILEYMAMKKAVIAPRLGPIEEILKDNEQGILFDRLNKEQMVGGLMKLLKDRDFSKQVSENAFSNLLLNHTWTKTAQRIIERYNRNRRK